MVECEECFYSSVDFEEYGSGEDENGEFTDYICSECGHVNRVYDNLESEL